MCALIQRFGVNLDASVYYIDRLPVELRGSEDQCSASKEAPQAGPAGHTVPASCGQEPQKARPRLAWPGERCSPVMGWPGACGKAHSFYAHAQQPCRGPWQVMVYREEGCAHCGDQESSMFRPSQIIPGSPMCAAVVAAGAPRRFGHRGGHIALHVRARAALQELLLVARVVGIVLAAHDLLVSETGLPVGVAAIERARGVQGMMIGGSRVLPCPVVDWWCVRVSC